MKYIKNISLLVLMLIGMAACVEKTPDYGNFPTKDVDFTYNVDGDQYKTDFYVVSTIQFNNTSSKSGAARWDFGDGETSTENNPTHKYKAAGVYKVKLTIDGVGERIYPLLIYDIAPVLSVTQQSASPIVINDVDVELGITLPNPENLICKYEWTFPEGTMDADGNIVASFTGYSHEDGSIDYPGKLKFKHIGSQKIEIKTWFDINGENRRLEDSYVNVQVGCNYPCKTVYYAVLDGNVKAYKLVDMSKLPEGTKNNPFDLGVKSGSTPQNLVYAHYKDQDLIFILDCGKQFNYITAPAGLGDGKITVMNSDASVVDIFVSNIGGDAYEDPFHGFADDEDLYYTDRNTGIRRMSLDKRGQVETNDYFVQNNWIGYYGKGIAWGAIHNGIFKDSQGMWYWGKDFNAYGFFRFQASDVQQGMDPNKVALPHPIILSNAYVSAFTVDEKNGKFYAFFRDNENMGLNVFDLPAYDKGLDLKERKVKVAMDCDLIKGSGEEAMYVTQLALDKATGRVYFGFTPTSKEKNYTLGIKYYDPETQTVKNLFDNNEQVLGIAVCDTETELF